MFRFTIVSFLTILLSGCLGSDSCSKNSPSGMCACTGGDCRPMTNEEANASRETTRREAADKYAARAASKNNSDLTATKTNQANQQNQNNQRNQQNQNNQRNQQNQNNQANKVMRD